MPIYEFKCESCEHIDELLMKINDPPPEKCSVCGAKVHKIMSRSSFSLKGTGWYVTDYKNNSPAPAETGESKPAVKPETTPPENSSAETAKSTDTKTSTEPKPNSSS